MPRRNNDFQPQGEPWRRPVERKPHISTEEIIRRAWAKHRADTSTAVHEINLSRPDKNKEMIERLVQGVKQLGAKRVEQPYDDGGWY